MQVARETNTITVSIERPELAYFIASKWLIDTKNITRSELKADKIVFVFYSIPLNCLVEVLKNKLTIKMACYLFFKGKMNFANNVVSLEVEGKMFTKLTNSLRIYKAIRKAFNPKTKRYTSP